MTLEADFELRIGLLRLQVSLAAVPGETIVLVGPNGAGKTTCLRALAGLIPIERGRVRLDGRVLEDAEHGTRAPSEQRGVGFVFQDYLLFSHLSARDNVAFGLRARGMARRQANAAAVAWLERFGLAQLSSALPRQLSGGQSQKVALARALAISPRLLLLDEPLAALDANARLELRRDLRRHLAEYGGIRIVVTHDALEAVALADQLVVLESGSIVQVGTVAAVCERPRSRYVAELVGVNLFRGTASAGRIDLASGAMLVSASALVGQVFATVHPRAVALYRSRPEGTPRNVWPARIEGLEAAVDRIRVRLGGQLPIVAEVTPAAVAELQLAEGGELWVSVKATEIAVYEV